MLNRLKELWKNPTFKVMVMTLGGGAVGAAGGVYQAGALVLNKTTITASLIGAGTALWGLFTQHPTNPGPSQK
jgi:hypothetical protein